MHLLGAQAKQWPLYRAIQSVQSHEYFQFLCPENGMKKNVCSNRKLSKFPLVYILSITEDYGIRKMLRGKTYMCGARHYLYQYSIRFCRLCSRQNRSFAICEKSIANISDLFRPYFLSLPLFPNWMKISSNADILETNKSIHFNEMWIGLSKSILSVPMDVVHSISKY